MSVERVATLVARSFAAALLLLSACDVLDRPPVPTAADHQRLPAAPAAPPPLEALSAPERQHWGITDPATRAFRFSDQRGDHVAIFSREETREEDPTDEVVTDRIVLSAVAHRLPATLTGEPAAWQHSDYIECDGVDIEADFYPETFSVTDLDGDGTAELTFAYHRFCGGGIEPADVTVVLEEGGASYVLTGQSLVRVGNDPAFGGQFTMDDALTAAPAWLQEKVLTIFEQVRDGTSTDAPAQKRSLKSQRN